VDMDLIASYVATLIPNLIAQAIQSAQGDAANDAAGSTDGENVVAFINRLCGVAAGAALTSSASGTLPSPGRRRWLGARPRIHHASWCWRAQSAGDQRSL
jgi:hypothetical protein